MTNPAPPTAREPRWTMCQSVGSPSLAEYWHIGDTNTRLRILRSRRVIGEKSWLLIIASLAFGALLAVTNTLLAERIKQNEIDKFNKLAAQMIEGSKNFESVSEDGIKITSAKGKAIAVDVKQATDSVKKAGDSVQKAGEKIGDAAR